MSLRNRTPSLLEPYLQLPSELFLILITGTLGCTPHWLTSLFVGRTLSQNSTDTETLKSENAPGIVFVSWMRDVDFWRTHIRRTTGIDVSKFEQQNRIVFIDALFTPPTPNTSKSDPLSIVEKRIRDSIASISASSSSNSNSKKTPILILDSPDVLLATGSATSQQLTAFTLHLRAEVHSTILSCSADLPLVSAAAGRTAYHHADSFPPLPLEVESAAFVTQVAHAAHLVLGVRELQTGAAKDVSGVLRVTRGGDVYAGDELDGRGSEGTREVEVLYLVQRDGSVKVFARGQGGG